MNLLTIEEFLAKGQRIVVIMDEINMVGTKIIYHDDDDSSTSDFQCLIVLGSGNMAESTDLVI